MKSRAHSLFLSKVLSGTSRTQRIAYIAVMTALCAVCNMFFEFKFADTQFSLTIFFSMMTGIIIGPLFGFVSCFLGDLVGFLYHSGGYAYYPWIGISMGMVALISGLVMNGVSLKLRGGEYVKLGLISALTFLVCTLAINTTSFWIVYNNMNTPYLTYVCQRLFIQGQIWNSVLNYALSFATFPTLMAVLCRLTGE